MQHIAVSALGSVRVFVYKESLPQVFIDVKSHAVFGTVTVLTEWELVCIISFYTSVLLLLLKVFSSIWSYQSGRSWGPLQPRKVSG